VRFLLHRDTQAQFRFASIQSESGRSLMLSHGLDPASPLSLLLVEDGNGYTDTDAIARVLRRLHRWPWRVIATCMLWIPRVARDPLYRFVARHRYRLFGRSDQCFVPSEEQRARFMP
jgi:predicted DCC family thiol-disulfide oxidoreductase YuxK